VLLRSLIAVAVALVLANVGVALANGGSAAPAPVVRAGVSSKSNQPSYCDTARAALQYEGHSAARLTKLMNRTIAIAPDELVSILRAVRDTDAGTHDYVAAHRLWDYYNNNHCCQCIDAYLSPEISDLTPEQRQHIEDGKPL